MDTHLYIRILMILSFYFGISVAENRTFRDLGEVTYIQSFNEQYIIDKITTLTFLDCYSQCQRTSSCQAIAYKNSECNNLNNVSGLIMTTDTTGYKFINLYLTIQCIKNHNEESCLSKLQSVKVTNLFKKTKVPNASLDSGCNVVADNTIIPSYCFLQNGGWIVIQQRVDDSVTFSRHWNDYVKGFGSPTGNFWIGLENMHRLTKSHTMELLIDLYTFDAASAYALYDSFAIGDASTSYTLTSLGNYSGNAGDSFKFHRNVKFSTISSCALYFKSGWWHDNCYYCNLNGEYQNQPYPTGRTGIHWGKFRGYSYSLRKVVMRIRAK